MIMNDPRLKRIGPEEIEAESFRLIEAELGPHRFSQEEFAVVRRAIHATGDFSFAANFVFHPRAIAAGLAAIRAGKDILVDVNMAAAGISSRLLESFGGQVRCLVADPEVAATARASGRTRSEVAIEKGLMAGGVGVVAVGNAPTALLAVIDLIRARPGLAPDLVIGAPVGFVNAAESKEILAEEDWPFITCLGRKGGTPVAVAAVNALLRLAAS